MTLGRKERVSEDTVKPKYLRKKDTLLIFQFYTSFRKRHCKKWQAVDLEKM